MIQYRVKSPEGIQKFVEIEREHPDGYEVVVTNIYEDYKKEHKEFINRHLFETCLRTGYLIKIEGPAYAGQISA